MLNTCQTDSESAPVEKTKPGTGIEVPEAPKPVQSTLVPNVPPPNHPLGASVAASEPEVPGVAQKAPEPTKEVPPPVAEAPKPVTEASKPAEEPTKPSEEAAKPVTQEPQIGEKRDLDSMATQAPGPDGGKPPVPEPTAEKVDGPESKKQKTEQEPTKDTNGTTPAPTSTTTAPPAAAPEEPKNAGRSKKEKIKETVKKIIPTDGPGSRTRSRTKDT